jgi:flagellar biosynthesis chaperone FliJ
MQIKIFESQQIEEEIYDSKIYKGEEQIKRKKQWVNKMLNILSNIYENDEIVIKVKEREKQKFEKAKKEIEKFNFT